MDYESVAHLAPTPSYALESSDGESDYEDELPSLSRVTRKPAPAPEVEVTFSGATDKLKATGGEAVFLVGEAGERMAQGVAFKASSGEDEETVSVLVNGEQVRLSVELFVATTQSLIRSAPETGRLDRPRNRLGVVHPRLSLDGPPARRAVSPRGTRARTLATQQGHRHCLLPPAVLHPAERDDPDSASGNRASRSVPRFFSLSLPHRHQARLERIGSSLHAP